MSQTSDIRQSPPVSDVAVAAPVSTESAAAVAAPVSVESDAPKSPAGEGASQENTKGSPLRHLLREWVVPFLVVLVVVFSLRSAVADWNDVPTGSMRPTILEGERIFVNKLAYDLKVPFTLVRLLEWGAPERGDVVVFYSPAEEHRKRLVKRVVGVPGDRLVQRGGHLLINGEPAVYRPLHHDERDELGIVNGTLDDGERVVWESVDGMDHPVALKPFPQVAFVDRDFGPIEVPEGVYFVMGDNRDNSTDSRIFGFVDKKLIVGRATAVVFSLDPENSRAPRWSRFFTALP